VDNTALIESAKSKIRPLIKPALSRLGYEIVRRPGGMPVDFDELHRTVWRAVQPFTMTSPERIYAAVEAARYVVRNQIPGAIVECGVWRGGSSMAMAMALQSLGVKDRHLYLYDTFTGMSEPTEVDIRRDGESSLLKYEITDDWCRCGSEEVAANIAATGYPSEMVTLVKGKVEDTLPDAAPSEIALLRLDTDWYESTRHELIHLYPRLSEGGVLILDDYGSWQGARKAVDEYFSGLATSPLLCRIDHTGRTAIRR
jgi:O-methyltransferase